MANENTLPDIEKDQVSQDQSQDGIDIEIVDDTPAADRNRKPPVLSDDEELSTYSEKVQKRIKDLSYKQHEERRAKESAIREREEALRFAQAQAQEVNRLKGLLTTGEKAFVTEAQNRISSQLAQAKLNYKAAFDAGDAEKMAEMNSEIASLAAEKHRFTHYQPQQPPQEAPQQNRQTQPVAQAPRDERAERWMSENPWFMKDESKTGYMIGVHEKLVKQGFHPQSDEYYSKIDKAAGDYDRAMSSLQSDGQKEQQQGNQQSGEGGHQVITHVVKKQVPVAPRNPTPQSGGSKKRIQMTASQLAVAKKLGVPPEEYHRQLQILEEKKNG